MCVLFIERGKVSRTALRATRTIVYRWIAIQSLAVMVISSLFFLWQGIAFAGSVFLGGLLCILPNVLFAVWWFAYFRVNAANHLVKVFYFGELFKLFFIGFLFVWAQKFLFINLLAALIGFMGAQVAFWFAPLFKRCSSPRR